ncbi:prepilin-type N-terminal cleavage/methylation domain-containing protein [Salinibacterium sp. ZJ77]|uniref:prepilin-type N-terminal cleavage/methylation domain-containing protein n=1 Tax=Salinibacterium sp. ZJ77 TaxID=2708337 RepID=UPI001FB994C0|nr:prepilin-type N-terminal cleavage/methylation domain-containing protein [Salinibacterium sp. ZJ77]
MTRIQKIAAERMELVRQGKADKGFTLIELLVVIIIIGVLAAIAVPVFLNVREGAWRSSVESDVNSARLAVEQFAMNNNGSVTGAATVVVGGTPQTIGTQVVNASADNTITITTTSASDYTITGVNTNLTGQTYTYTSAGGTATW